MAVCSNIARFLLILVGVCYLVSAGVLSYIGVWVYTTYQHYDDIASSTMTLVPATIILGVSVFMLIIGILACMAGFKKSKVLLATFFCLVLLVFVGEVTAAILGYVYRGKVEKLVNDDLQDAIDHYNVTSNKDQIDYLQKELHCCGIHNATDWFSSTYWKQNHTVTVPESCCRHNDTCIAKIDNTVIYTEGCLDSLKNKFSDNLVKIAAATIGLAVIQIMSLLASCIMICRAKDQASYQTLGDPIGGGLRV